jgi:hypothetical protein
MSRLCLGPERQRPTGWDERFQSEITRPVRFFESTVANPHRRWLQIAVHSVARGKSKPMDVSQIL